VLVEMSCWRRHFMPIDNITAESNTTAERNLREE
jgi:hypothetical protein